VLLLGGPRVDARAQTGCADPIPGLTDCIRDSDCIYWDTRDCCPCNDGGAEIAINKAKLRDLELKQNQCCAGTACLTILNCSFEATARCVDGTCALGRCGDAIVAPTGEQCDAGGQSAGCDDDCTSRACGDWTVNASAGESCDDGNADDGDGCSSACVCDDATDLDADGIGDACDSCVNTSGPATESQIGFKKVGTDSESGNDVLKLRLEYTLGDGASFATLDPSISGMRLLVTNASGVPVADIDLPAGAFDGTRGWRKNGSGTNWQYKDKTSPPLVSGISVVQLKDRSAKAPALVAVTLNGSHGDYAVGPGDVPLRVVVSVGGGAGRCGEAAYARASCRVSAKGDRIDCK